MTNTREIFEDARQKWDTLTGVSQQQTTFRLGDLDVRSMNESLDSAIELEPEGTTAFLLLECFLRAHLQEKTFTAAQIMKDYDALTAYLARAQDMFSILQSDHAVEMTAEFRAKVRAGISHYDALSEDVQKLIDEPEALAFLRRDALHAHANLNAFQFLSGEHDSAHPQVMEHIYQAWDINSLLFSLRDMPISGIAVVLLRDPAHPDRSYFAFAMRNGENVTLFTDKDRPAFPGQEDRMRGRGAGRAFAKRAWENHFPYQLIKTKVDDRGDVIFESETSPVMAGKDLVPLMTMRELPDYQIVWLTMMLSLIADKFWTQKWQAPALSYTGAMVTEKTVLVEGQDGTKLPVAAGYTPIGLDTLTLKDITRSAMAEQVEKVTNTTNWLEERYAHSADPKLFNIWTKDDDLIALLPSVKKNDDRGFEREQKAKSTALSPNILSYSKKEIKKLPFWDTPKGYTLKSFTPTMFGTEEDLTKDSHWIARHNLAQHIQREADIEFEARKPEIAKWFIESVTANKDALARRAAQVHQKRLDGDERYERATTDIAPTDSNIWSYEKWGGTNAIGEYTGRSDKFLCAFDETKSSWRIYFRPQNAQDLADLCGCKVSELPDILQNWEREKAYTGNGILDRLDPVENEVDDPWRKLPLQVNLYLSKRAMTRFLKQL